MVKRVERSVVLSLAYGRATNTGFLCTYVVCRKHTNINFFERHRFMIGHYNKYVISSKPTTIENNNERKYFVLTVLQIQQQSYKIHITALLYRQNYWKKKRKKMEDKILKGQTLSQHDNV